MSLFYEKTNEEELKEKFIDHYPDVISFSWKTAAKIQWERELRL